MTFYQPLRVFFLSSEYRKMSSVQRFLKQVPQGLSYISGNALGTVASNAYVLIPSSSNVVGNYPSSGGAMVPVTAADAGVKPVFDAISNALSTANGAVYVAVLRDMGKTVFGQTAADSATALTTGLTGQYGYFRKVQLLVPQATNASQVGGANSSPFGVLSSSPTYAPYLTFYLPVPVAGVLLQDPQVSSLLGPVVGGQM